MAVPAGVIKETCRLPLPKSYRNRTDSIIMMHSDELLPSFIWTGWEVLEAPYTNSRHCESLGIDLKYIVSGALRFISHDKEYILKTGDLIILASPDIFHCALPEGWATCEMISLFCNGRDIHSHAAKLMATIATPVLHLQPDDPLLVEFLEIVSLIFGRQIHQVEAIEKLLYGLLLDMRSALMPLQTNAPLPVLRVQEYIRTHLHDDLSLSKLAEIAILSRTCFGRLFRQTMHMTPIQYVTQERMRNACNLLEHSEYSIGDIAVLCGYNEQSYFCNTFQKHRRMSPSQYRNYTSNR